MVVPVNVRAGRATAIFAGFQPAQGTPVSDFTAVGSKRLWTQDAPIWTAPDVMVERYMDADYGPHDDPTYVSPEEPEGEVAAIGTPTSIEWLMRSNFGAFAAGAFTLATGIASDRWLTFGLVEDRFAGVASTSRLIRHRDCFVHKLAFRWDGSGDNKRLILRGTYSGRKILSQLLNAGGITLPATPMQPSDKVIFPTQNTVLTRDPSGANVSYRFRDLRVTFDQGLGKDWDMGASLYDVYKAGPLMATLEVASDWSDETWALRDLCVAGTAAQYRIVSTSESGVVLTVNLYGVTLRPEAAGHSGMEYKEFRARGTATRVGTNLVTVAMA